MTGQQAADYTGGGADHVAAVLRALADRDVEAAEAALVDLRRTQADPVLSLILSALLLVRMGEFFSAVEALRAAEKARPDAQEIQDILSILLARLGQQTESLFHSKMVVATVKAFPDFNLSPDWLGNFSDAFLGITERVLWKEGRQALKAGQPALARQRFIEASSLDRNDPQIWADLARTSLAQGLVVEAVRAAEVVVSLEGDEAASHALHALCLQAMGRLDEARAAAGEALALDPANPDIAGGFIYLNGFAADATPASAQAFAEAWRNAHGHPDIRTSSNPAPMRGRGRVGILSSGLNAGGNHAMFLSTIEQALYRAADLIYYALDPLEDNVSRRMQRTASRWLNLADVDDETAAFILSNENLDCLIDLDGFQPGARPGIVARADIARIWSPFTTPGAGPRLDGTSLLDPFCPATAGEEGRILVMPSGLSTWAPYRGVLPEGRARRFSGARHGRALAIDADLARHGPEALALLAALAEADGGLCFLIGRRFLAEEEALGLFLRRAEAAGIDPKRMEVLPPGTGLEELLRPADGVVAAWPAPDPAFLSEAVRYGLPVVLAKPALDEHAGGASLLGSNGLGRSICPVGSDFAAAALDWLDRWSREDALRKTILDGVDAAARGEGSYERGRSFLAFLAGATETTR